MEERWSRRKVLTTLGAASAGLLSGSLDRVLAQEPVATSMRPKPADRKFQSAQ